LTSNQADNHERIKS